MQPKYTVESVDQQGVRRWVIVGPQIEESWDVLGFLDKKDADIACACAEIGFVAAVIECRLRAEKAEKELARLHTVIEKILHKNIAS